MKIETKYNIGDSFWTMYRDEPIEIKITSLSISIDDKGITTRYTLRGLVQGANYAGMTEENINEYYCKTKKDLMIKVFGNI